jgi:hypothetical protein
VTDVLSPENEELLRAYRLTFNSPAGQTVLIDLMKFCKFRVPIDDRLDEGKRQAFLRIENFLNLTPEQLASLYRGQATTAPTGENDE